MYINFDSGGFCCSCWIGSVSVVDMAASLLPDTSGIAVVMRFAVCVFKSFAVGFVSLCSVEVDARLFSVAAVVPFLLLSYFCKEKGKNFFNLLIIFQSNRLISISI